MGIENYREQIDKLYLEYINELKPLIAMVEHNYRKFPMGVLKEFRDVFDHISRLYIDGESDEYYVINISKALNHFDRLRLDIYKYVCDLKKKNIDEWLKRYLKYDMSCVDNGEFWEKVIEDFDKCEETFYYGQAQEHLNIKEACDYYERYVIQCDDVFEYIKSKEKYIRRIKYKYYKTALKSGFAGLVIGIIGSIIASIIWSGALEQVFNTTDIDGNFSNELTQPTIVEIEASK